MTNFERAEQALKRNIPDMVPIFELVIDPGVINRISPGCGYPDFVDKYDFDIVLTGTPSLNYRKETLDKESGTFRDDYAGNSGPMMSPECFEEFFLPGMKEVVLAAKSAGAFTIKHTDGDINKIIEMLISTGIDGLHPIDPEAGMNIREVKKKYGRRICVIGNIDTGKILTESSPEKVAETVKNTIAGAAPGGGYIISSSNSIHSHVKPENYVAMLESARKYGKY